MYRAYEQNQMFLLPPNMKDFINESHPAHIVNDLVEKIDLSCLEKRYGNMGQTAYHPRMIIKVILYGFLVTDAGYGNSNALESCQSRKVIPVNATAVIKLAKGGPRGADFTLLRLRETFLSGVAQYMQLFRFLVSPISWRIAPLTHCG